VTLNVEAYFFFRIRWKGYDKGYDILDFYIDISIFLEALGEYIQREISSCPDLKDLNYK
jgi:hypothetical protein